VATRKHEWAVNPKKIQPLWGEEGVRLVVMRGQKRVGFLTCPPLFRRKTRRMCGRLICNLIPRWPGNRSRLPPLLTNTHGEQLGETSITWSPLKTPSTSSMPLSSNAVCPAHSARPQARIHPESPREWANEVDLVSIPSGRAWQNRFVESFNTRRRDGCRSVNQFYSLSHAKAVIGTWKEDDSTTRPHSSLGYLAPEVYARNCTQKNLGW